MICNPISCCTKPYCHIDVSAVPWPHRPKVGRVGDVKVLKTPPTTHENTPTQQTQIYTRKKNDSSDCTAARQRICITANVNTETAFTTPQCHLQRGDSPAHGNSIPPLARTLLLIVARNGTRTQGGEGGGSSRWHATPRGAQRGGGRNFGAVLTSARADADTSR